MRAFISLADASPLLKFAEEAPQVPEGAKTVASPMDVGVKSPWLHAAGVLGAGALGTGAGMLTGALLGKLIDHGSTAATGAPVPLKYLQYSLPVLGFAGGVASKLYQDHQQQELQRALHSYHDQRSRKV